MDRIYIVWDGNWLINLTNALRNCICNKELREPIQVGSFGIVPSCMDFGLC